MIASITQYLVALPLPAELLLKVTLLLAVAWLLHGTLEKANPRWRVLLWRVTAVASLALPFIVLGLPAWSLPIAGRPTTADQERAFLRRLAIAEYADAVGISYNPFEGMVTQPGTLSQTSVAPTVAAEPDLPAALAATDEGPALEAAPLTREVLLARQQAEAGAPTPIASLTPHTAETPAAGLTLPIAVIAAWLTIVLVLACRLGLQHWALRLHVKDSWPVTGVVSGLARRLMERLGVGLTVDVRSSAKISSPFLIGVSAPVIMLSERIASGRDEKELRSVLAHELAHVAEQDVLWSLIIEAVAALLWFHPLAWKMRAAHAAACEEAADLAAAHCVGDPRLYSAALARVALDVLTGPGPVAGTVPMARIPEIRQRLEKLRSAVKGGSPRGRTVYTGIAIAAVLVLALGSLRVVQAGDDAPGAPDPGSPQAAPPAPPAPSAPLAPMPGTPAMRYRVQLNGVASDSKDAAEEAARVLAFDHGITEVTELDVVDINGKRTVLVGAPQDRREAADEQAGALRSQGLDCTVVEVPAQPMPPPGPPGAVVHKEFQYRYASDPAAAGAPGPMPGMAETIEAEFSRSADPFGNPHAALWSKVVGDDANRIRASVLSLEPDSPKLDTDEKKQAFIAQVREVIETLLYTGTTKEEAEKQGRKTWFDPATYRLTITDTADRIAVVREYLQGVPELEKSNPAVTIRRMSTGLGGMPDPYPRQIAEIRARAAVDSARVRTFERSLAPLREGMNKEIADKLREEGFLITGDGGDKDLAAITEAIRSDSGEHREQLIAELHRITDDRARQGKELARAHADEARVRADDAMVRVEEMRAAKEAGGRGGRTMKSGPSRVEVVESDEDAIAKVRDQAIERGEMLAALDAEMQRVLLRQQNSNDWKDKITLLPVSESAYTSGIQWATIAEAAHELLDAHPDEPGYTWRIQQLIGYIEGKTGSYDDAIKHYKSALEAYPDTAYPDPAKQSSYQHLVNQYLAFISKTEGPKTAEKTLLDLIEKDPKLDAPFLSDDLWKSDRKPADYEKLQEKVESARKTRSANGL